MADRIIIGMGGRKESGKDTVADFLVEEHGYTKHEMSSVLHDIFMVMDPWVSVREDEAEISEFIRPGFMRYSTLCATIGYVEAKRFREVRRLLQALGTDVGRNMISEDVWVDVMRHKITNTEGNFVFTGVRYHNERALLRELGGTAVWVNRPGLPEGDTHTSETSLGQEDFDMVLDNTADLAHLRKVADGLHRNLDRKSA